MLSRFYGEGKLIAGFVRRNIDLNQRTDEGCPKSSKSATNSICCSSVKFFRGQNSSVGKQRSPSGANQALGTWTRRATLDPAGAPASSPCRTLGLVAIMPSWPPNWLFIWGIPAQLGLTAADNAKKLQFQMNVFWLKAARIVPKGGPRRDT